MSPLSVSDGTQWRPARKVSVMVGGVWKPAVKASVSDGKGGWTVVWMPAMDNVAITLAPSPVLPNQYFNATASFVTNLPAGANVAFRCGGFTTSVVVPAPTKVVTVNNMVHNAPGAYDWYVDLTIGAVTETHGPTTQGVESPIGSLVLDPFAPVVQGTAWTARASMVPAPPLGSRVKFVATNTQNANDKVDSGWLPWGTPFTHTDALPLTRSVVATIETPAKQTATDTEQLVVKAASYEVTVPSGGNIQAALDSANLWFLKNRTFPVNFDDPVNTMATVKLVPGGTYSVGSHLYYRGGVRLLATGAFIRATAGQSTHIMHNSEHGGGNYSSPHTDWMIEGGTLDCANYSGGISTSHTKRFRLQDVTIKNIGGRKHHLEINSSGGPLTLGTYNCQVYDCTFLQETKSTAPSPARAEDEMIQLDFSWDGAAPTTANDGTVTNNVHIKGCTFTNGPRGIGGHTYDVRAKGIHSNVRIEDCSFTGHNPDLWGNGANGSESEGALRVYNWSYVSILNNTFTRCLQPICIYIPQGAMNTSYNCSDITITGNTLDDCGGGARHGIYGNADNDSGKSIWRVLAKNNILTGEWMSTGYFVGFVETNGQITEYGTGAAIINNAFKPSNYDAAQQISYNKYRAASTPNLTGVTISGNTVSDGTESNV